MGLDKHPDLPDTPLIMDLARTDEERAIFKLIFARQVMAWPFATPPGVPAERVALLRKAFMETLRDKDFLADAGKAISKCGPSPARRFRRWSGRSMPPRPRSCRRPRGCCSSCPCSCPDAPPQVGYSRLGSLYADLG